MNVPFKNLLPIQRARVWVVIDSIITQNPTALLRVSAFPNAEAWYKANVAPVENRYAFAGDYWEDFQNHPKLKAFVLEGAE